MSTDPVGDRFQQIKWHYAPGDAAARAELKRRIAEVGRRRGLITYSDLARGITFHLPNLKEPKHQIDVHDWQDLDRAIIGDFLGYLSMQSYEKAGFFSSALVVGKLDGSPGEGFYNLLRELGLIASSKSDKAMYLWADHVAKAHTWYSTHSGAA
jgi:hypothetical protein